MIKKILLLAALFGIIFSTTSFAQQRAIAEVNIGGTKIANQIDHNLNISFVISNGSGVQSGVKYGVRLQTKGGLVVDEKVYDEVLVLSPQSNINKSIIYTAPEALSGTYSVYVVTKNTDGLPLGASFAGEATLSALKKGIYLALETCSTSISGTIEKSKIDRSLTINLNQSITLTCIAQNMSANAISVTPQYETHTRTLYGEVATHGGGDIKTIDFKPNEKKTISLTLPKASASGLYTISTYLKGPDSESNKINLSYSISGSNFTILNVSTDKDFYSNKDTAIVNVVWIGEGTSSADVKITSGGGAVCGNVTGASIVQTNGKILVPITRTCNDPSIALSIKDESGNILGEKTTVFKSTSSNTPGGKNATKIVLIALAAIIAISLLMRSRNKAVITALVISASFALIPVSEAGATTYQLSSGIFLEVNVNNINHPGSTTYNQGDTIQVNGSIVNSTAKPQDVRLSAVTIGNNSVNLFTTNEVTINSNTTAYGLTKYFTVNVPSVPGTYEVVFTAQVFKESFCAITLHFDGGTRRGKIDFYTSPENIQYRTNHPPLNVTVTVYGFQSPLPGTVYPSDPRDVTFTIPANQTDSYYNGMNCNSGSSYGCEFESTRGFDQGWITNISPNTTYDGGDICMQ